MHYHLLPSTTLVDLPQNSISIQLFAVSGENCISGGAAIDATVCCSHCDDDSASYPSYPLKILYDSYLFHPGELGDTVVHLCDICGDCLHHLTKNYGICGVANRDSPGFHCTTANDYIVYFYLA